MVKPSRALIIYSFLVLCLGIGFYAWGNAWDDGGKSARKIAEKHAAGVNIPLKLYLNHYGPMAAKVNAGLCLVLLALGPFAVRKLHGKSPEPFIPVGRKQTLALVLLTMCASAAWMFPRFSHSLWADEMTSMRRYMVGDYARWEDGKMGLLEVDALTRQFNLKSPNNHMLYSTLAGTLHAVAAKPKAGPQDVYFSEWLLRLPAFLAGMAALGTLAWLAGEVRVRHAGWLAVILLVLHPWHLRYSSEARGYSMILAMIPALIASGLIAIRTGRWRWWITFALLQVAMINTWPLAANVVIVVNFVVVVLLWKSHWSQTDRRTQFFRWAMLSGFGAMLAIQLMLPTAPQIAEYIRVQTAPSPFRMELLVNALCSLFTGGPWSVIDPANPYLFSWESSFAAHPISSGLFFALLVILFACGLVRLFRMNTTCRVVAVLTVMIPSSIMLQLLASKYLFLSWYWVPALPLTMFTLAVGLDWLTGRLKFHRAITGGAVLGVVALALYPQHAFLRNVPVQQNREAALLTRSILNPSHPEFGKESITAYVSMFYPGYDCDAKRPLSAAEMTALMEQSDRENRPLFVNLSRANLARPQVPDVFQILENPAYFKMLPPLYGTEEDATKFVFQYIPGSVAKPNQQLPAVHTDK